MGEWWSPGRRVSNSCVMTYSLRLATIGRSHAFEHGVKRSSERSYRSKSRNKVSVGEPAEGSLSVVPSRFPERGSFGCDRRGPLPLSVRGTRRSPSGRAEGARRGVVLGRRVARCTEEPIKGEVLPPSAGMAGPPRAPLQACFFFVCRSDVRRVSRRSRVGGER